MKLRKNSTTSGFTLTEVMIAMAITVFLLSIMAPIAANFYSDYQLDAEKNTLVSLLRQALNDSLINRNESPHGLHWDANNFVVFQGGSYADRRSSVDRIFPRTSAITLSGPTELVFSQLSGRTASSTYSLSNSTNTYNIYINSEGAVSD